MNNDDDEDDICSVSFFLFFFLYSLLPAKECVPAASRQVLNTVTIIHGS